MVLTQLVNLLIASQFNIYTRTRAHILVLIRTKHRAGHILGHSSTFTIPLTIAVLNARSDQWLDIFDDKCMIDINITGRIRYACSAVSTTV